jgi:GNAT superfamily N-acetyltransferase
VRQASVRQARGLDYLRLVTTLLQRARLASPTGGLWEAADLQWWWRRDQHPDAALQTFWMDGDGPVAAVIFSAWTGRVGCDLISADHGPGLDALWPVALDRMRALPATPIEMRIDDDDSGLVEAVTAAGFVPTDERDVTTWMRADERPEPPRPPDGFRVAARTQLADRPHHMRRRNGEHVAERLAECDLYDPELDLAVLDPDGKVAGYALFWADPVTGVGLVEPMRTEDGYQGRGLGRLLLATGLDRLAARGCTRLKVSYIPGNDAARRLYLGAGFHPTTGSRIYRIEP